MAEHTPGQWTVHWHTAQGGDGHWIMDAKDCGELSRLAMVVFHDDESANETRANARLIASAPELLEELKEAERVLRWAAQESAGRVRADVVNGWLHHAEKLGVAIAKAEGRVE